MAAKPLRVLIVDDEHSVADTMALVSNHSGHDAIAVYSGQEAIDRAPIFHPQVVILDVMMPGLNGFELARHFAVHLPECRVLLMSGHSSALEKADDFVSSGVFANVLAKPILPQTLVLFLAHCAVNLN